MMNLLNFIDNSPNAFLAVDNIKKILIENGYKKLEGKINKGEKYYITRNGSSIIAFNIGSKLDSPSLQISASHTDCPSFKLKPNPIIKTKYGCKLNVEEYGGLLKRPWFDRPLSLAGRVILKNNNDVYHRLLLDTTPFCIIPSVAPHLNREIESKPIDVSVDLVPIISLSDDFDFNAFIAKKLNVNKEDIISFDLYLYPLSKGYIWGNSNEFYTSNHIDNLECAYTTLLGFINNFNDNNINIYASFDNEEVGSLTRQGADSDFLDKTLSRICTDLNINKDSISNKGIMLSCDNAHGIHPNHPELYDLNNAPELNKGVVIKYNANQSYTSDGYGTAIIKNLMNHYNIPYQTYANKTGIKGGSTLGNISNRHLSLVSVDIGLAQWAMHSPIETCGTKDIEAMINLIKVFYSNHLNIINE